MKVSELEGADLDYWVAIAIGMKNYIYPGTGRRYSPSSDWSQGGPIIERERMSIRSVTPMDTQVWYVELGLNCFAYGETMLIAAMRCYVASKFGEEVSE